MSRPPSRGAIALAGLLSVRVALALGASVGLHWGALQAIGDGVAAAPSGGPAGAAPSVLRIVPVNAPVPAIERDGARVPATRPARDAGQPRAAAAAGAAAAGGVSPPAAGAGGAPARPSSAAAAVLAAGPGPATSVATTADVARVATASSPSSPSSASSASSAEGELAFLEPWEVDHPPEFLYPPEGLDALPELAGRATELRVAIRVDASGRRVGVESVALHASADVAARLQRAVEDAFSDVAFLPARRDGKPVPAVLRWTVALDPRAPIALGFRLQN